MTYTIHLLFHNTRDAARYNKTWFHTGWRYQTRDAAVAAQQDYEYGDGPAIPAKVVAIETPNPRWDVI